MCENIRVPPPPPPPPPPGSGPHILPSGSALEGDQVSVSGPSGPLVISI